MSFSLNNKFADKKVLILGLGINQGGLGAAKFFAKAGAKLRVTDLKHEKELKPSLDELAEFTNIEYILGEHRFEDIDWADIIIRNPALKPGNLYREYAEKSAKRVELDMGFLFDFIKKEQIIGITGTKGKSTTSSLIYEILSKHHPNKNIRDNVIFAGNIGKSVLDSIEYFTPNTLLVLELSSFQLEAFQQHKISPKYSVITNIYEDHLNYYTNMDDYINAKRAIAQFQTEDDFLYLWQDDSITNSPNFLKNLKAQIIKFSSLDLPEEIKPILKGPHNLPNIAAGLAIAKTFGIDEKQALETMSQFRPVPFRQELIYNKDGLKIYNDTTATTPIAAVQALKTFNNCILITGGMNKNVSYHQLADAIDKHAKAVYFLEGDATAEIKSYLKHKNIQRSTYTNLEALLKDVKIESKKGDVILFSPGATSFNLFQNEFDRGRKFNAAVEKIFK